MARHGVQDQAHVTVALEIRRGWSQRHQFHLHVFKIWLRHGRAAGCWKDLSWIRWLHTENLANIHTGYILSGGATTSTIGVDRAHFSQPMCRSLQ